MDVILVPVCVSTKMHIVYRSPALHSTHLRVHTGSIYTFQANGKGSWHFAYLKILWKGTQMLAPLGRGALPQIYKHQGLSVSHSYTHVAVAF